MENTTTMDRADKKRKTFRGLRHPWFLSQFEANHAGGTS
jgi:hypothetical protein